MFFSSDVAPSTEAAAPLECPPSPPIFSANKYPPITYYSAIPDQQSSNMPTEGWAPDPAYSQMTVDGTYPSYAYPDQNTSNPSYPTTQLGTYQLANSVSTAILNNSALLSVGVVQGEKRRRDRSDSTNKKHKTDAESVPYSPPSLEAYAAMPDELRDQLLRTAQAALEHTTQQELSHDAPPLQIPNLATPIVESDFSRTKNDYGTPNLSTPDGFTSFSVSTPASNSYTPYTPNSHVSTPTSSSKRKGCTCKKSGCLKRYCECFAKCEVCTGECKCVDCCNNDDPDSKAKRDAGIHNVLVRNPLAFHQTDQRRHGCKCRRSGCVKKYCECYRASKTCTEQCECIYFQICQNNPRGGGSGVGVYAGVSPLPITDQSQSTLAITDETATKTEPTEGEETELGDREAEAASSLYNSNLSSLEAAATAALVDISVY